MKKLSRRAFLQGTAAAAAGLAVGGLSTVKAQSTNSVSIPFAQNLPTNFYLHSNWIWDWRDQKWVVCAPQPLPEGKEVQTFRDLFQYTDIALLPNDFDPDQVRQLPKPKQQLDLRNNLGLHRSLPLLIADSGEGQYLRCRECHDQIERELVGWLYKNYLRFKRAQAKCGDTSAHFVISTPRDEAKPRTKLGDGQHIHMGLAGLVSFAVTPTLPEGAGWPWYDGHHNREEPWYRVYRDFNYSRIFAKFDQARRLVQDLRMG